MMDNSKTAGKQPGDAVKDMSPEQILDLVRKSGLELTDEQLEEISGGGVWSDDEVVPAEPVCAFCHHSGTLIYKYGGKFCTNCFAFWDK